jgi:undecaprenyl-diphosphatase
MTIWQSILLGIIQGLTEFLPVSSSGHLVITPFLLGWDLPAQDAFIFDVLVQVATLLAVFAYFWNDFIAILTGLYRGLGERPRFQNQPARLGLLIFIASLPAGIIGLLLKDLVEAAFASPAATGFFLLITAALLIFAERTGKRSRSLQQITWKDALRIGFFQALAILPGISRSGATIAGAMTADLERAPAAKFSFLMSAPIMLAAGALTLLDLLKIPNLGQVLPVFIPGFIASALVGYLSIRWLLAFLTRRTLYPFAIYCALVGVLVLLLGILRA